MWIADNRLRNERGEVLEFRDHPFLVEPYEDLSPIQATIKCAQIGWSTLTILKTIWCAVFRHWNVIYTLPTADSVIDFVGSKVNPIIKENQFLAALVADKDSVQQKQIGGSFIFYRGTHSGRAKGEKMESGRGIMLTSDLNVHDESDRSDQQIIEQYESRLGNSEYKGRWYFSNPTAPGIGAHKHWLASNQKHWFLRCGRCCEWQYLLFPESICRERRAYQCRKCKGILSDDDRRAGRWIKRFRDRDISGYWISQMMNPRTSAAEILHQEATKDTQYFFNFVLGLPYKGSDVVVDREAIVRNVVLTANDRQGVAMGVDNGIEKYYVIGNAKGIFETGMTKDWDEIERLFVKYQASMVIDLNPYPKHPKALAKKYPGRIHCSFYSRDKADMGVVRWGKGEKIGMVYSDRNKIIQETIDAIADGTVSFNLPESALEDYIAHWDSLFQTIETDHLGIPRAVWNTVAGKPDHLVHATVYWLLAMRRVRATSEVVGTDETPFIRGKKSFYVGSDATIPGDPLIEERGERDWRYL